MPSVNPPGTLVRRPSAVAVAAPPADRWRQTLLRSAAAAVAPVPVGLAVVFRTVGTVQLAAIIATVAAAAVALAAALCSTARRGPRDA